MAYRRYGLAYYGPIWLWLSMPCRWIDSYRSFGIHHFGPHLLVHGKIKKVTALRCDTRSTPAMERDSQTSMAGEVRP